MKDNRSSAGQTRVIKLPRKHRSRQRPSSLFLSFTPRVTSVIHVSVGSARTVRSSAVDKNNRTTTERRVHRNETRSEKSSVRQDSSKRLASSTSSVTVHRVARSLSQRREQSSNSTNHLTKTTMKNCSSTDDQHSKDEVTNMKIREAFLRWNTTGITLFGTTGIRGNTSTQLSSPFGLLFDPLNNLDISDRFNHRIQKCHVTMLNCTTIAGRANAFAGNNDTDLNGPTYMYLDAQYNLYIADSGNQRVQLWKFGASNGTTIAGTTGSGGSALNQFNVPYGIAPDPYSNAVYIADHNNHRVMKYVSGTLSGTIVAGGNGLGTNTSQLYRPAGLFFDSSTNSLLIANFGASNIVQWSLSQNNWTILVGSANGLNGNSSTLLDHVTSFTFDPMGNVYVADMFNHRIQMYLPNQSNGTTIAGISARLGTNATMLNYPVSVAFDTQLNLYVTDSLNHRIQKFLRY